MGNREISPNNLIHFLPPGCIRELCEELEDENTWSAMASSMPDITMKDVEGCRKMKGRSSYFLLRIWSAKGYRIDDLRTLFLHMKYIRPLNIIDKYLSRQEYDQQSVEATFGSSTYSKTNESDLSTRTEKDFSLLSPSLTNSSVSKLTSSAGTSSGLSMDPLMAALQNTLAVPYEELMDATECFAEKNILGKGGYGIVYKGYWKQLNVAIKRITAQGVKGKQLEKERLRQSLQELRTLARYRHDNILPIYGFCLEGPEPCLVYMFMANGSLDERIACKRGTVALNWPQRMGIAEGTARGIHFLHTMASTAIIHGDVKSANILLDKHLEPKLGDFGLCRDGQMEAGAEEKSPLIASHLKGTLAYLPPEFISSKILSTKLDVFSFGIVLYELATGLKAYSENRQPRGLQEYMAFTRYEGEAKGKDPRQAAFEKLMDQRVILTKDEEDYSTQAFELLVQLGDRCANIDRGLRPAFTEIVDKLAALSSPFVNQ